MNYDTRRKAELSNHVWDILVPSPASPTPKGKLKKFPRLQAEQN